MSGVLTEERVLDRMSDEGVILAKKQVLDGMSNENGVLNEVDDEEGRFVDDG
jgi:hypothetical protein